jgi:hypothetical protein
MEKENDGRVCPTFCTDFFSSSSLYFFYGNYESVWQIQKN